jgi:hypothetical protein
MSLHLGFTGREKRVQLLLQFLAREHHGCCFEFGGWLAAARLSWEDGWRRAGRAAEVKGFSYGPVGLTWAIIGPPYPQVWATKAHNMSNRRSRPNRRPATNTHYPSRRRRGKTEGKEP